MCFVTKPGVSQDVSGVLVFQKVSSKIKTLGLARSVVSRTFWIWYGWNLHSLMILCALERKIWYTLENFQIDNRGFFFNFEECRFSTARALQTSLLS